MRISELRSMYRHSHDFAFHILSDGYDYLLQIEHERGFDTLTDVRGRRLVFHNLGDAQEQLRSLGIHHAMLNQRVAHDEVVGRLDEPERGRMPLRF